MAIFADPTNQNVAYVPEVDGVFKTNRRRPHVATITSQGDHHIIWVNRRNPKSARGHDGAPWCPPTAATVGVRKTISRRVSSITRARRQFPVPRLRRAADEARTRGRARFGRGIPLGDWREVARARSTSSRPQPARPTHVRQRLLQHDVALGQLHGTDAERLAVGQVMSGASAVELKERFGWTHPVMFSPQSERNCSPSASTCFEHGRRQTWKSSAPISRGRQGAPKARAAARSTTIRPAPKRSRHRVARGSNR